MNKKDAGFTLIELMLVVAIVAILAAIAYPSYQDQARKTRRADGQSMLMEVIQAQERFYTSNLNYTADLTELGYASDPIDSDEGYYSISAAACGGSNIGNCVELTATAQGGQLADGNLTLNSRGEKTPLEHW